MEGIGCLMGVAIPLAVTVIMLLIIVSVIPRVKDG